MSFISDLRAVSESSIEQLADRFSDLPRPLLAAIGAGEMAVERFAELRESLQHSIPTSPPDGSQVAAMAADLPARAQKAAAGVAGSLEQFASQMPAKAQEMVAELPAKVSEMAQALSAETMRETVEAYTQLAGVIYGNLAKRGDQTWSKMRSAGLPYGTVVTPAPAKVPTAKSDAPSKASATFPKDTASSAATAAKTPTPSSPPRARRTAAAAPAPKTGTAATPRRPRKPKGADPMPVVPPKATVADPGTVAPSVADQSAAKPTIRRVAPVRKPAADAGTGLD